MADEKILAAIDAEQAVLGSVLYDESVIKELSDKLKQKDFFYTRHQLIFDAMVDLYNQKVPIDSTTLITALQDKGVLNDCGGSQYIIDLAQSIPTLTNLDTYVGIVKDKSIQRNVVATCNDIIKATLESDISNSKEYLDNVEKSIYKVTSERLTKGLIPATDILNHARDMIEEAQRTSFTGVTGLDTGFTDLNRITLGFHGSELIILAARPSMGKTAMGLDIAKNIAMIPANNNPYVAFFSLEMSLEQLAYRLISSVAMVDQNALKTGRFESQNAWANINFAIERLSQCHLLFDDSGASTIQEVRSICRKKKAEGKLDFVVIDYLQLLASEDSKGNKNRADEIREISKSLKAMARELNIPVLALSQLSRKVDEREDKMPIMSDLRESGSIEQDADIIILFYRDEYYKKDKSEKPGVADVQVAKNRNGLIGKYQLAFRGANTTFTNLSKRDESEADTI